MPSSNGNFLAIEKKEREIPNLELESALQERRACRNFKQDKVPKSLVNKLIYAASRAPTASNIPCRHFIIVDDPKIIKSIKQISPSLLANPPMLFVIFTDLKIALEKTGKVAELSSLVDSGASGENVLLEATNLKLGSQFTMISSMAGIRTILGLPEYCRVDLIIPIGYPAVTHPKSVKARPGANVSYHNRFGDQYDTKD